MRRLPDYDQDVTSIQITVPIHDILHELANPKETYNQTITRLLKELAELPKYRDEREKILQGINEGEETYRQQTKRLLAEEDKNIQMVDKRREQRRIDENISHE